MKKILLLLLIFGISLAQSNAQSASASWPLTSVTTTNVINTGNVVGFAEDSSNMSIRDYTGTNGAQRSQISGGSWPGEGQQNNSRYLQFRISPATGSNFTVTNISLNIGAGGGSSMRANVAYSKDPAFASSTIIFPSTTALSQTALSPVANSPAGLLLLNGETLYLRIFPYYTTASTGKYVVLKDILISGTTNASTAAPTVSTSTVTNISSTSAKSGGSITMDGGSAILQKGVVWSTSVNPDVNNNSGITNDGNGTASFISTLSLLTPNTVYHVRAYATNSSGTGYGTDMQFATSLQTTNYYNKPNTDVANRLNWGTNTDGSGTPPAGFTSAAQVFIIVNDNAIMSSSWVVSGTDSKVILGSIVHPVVFTIPTAYNLDGIIDVEGSSALNIKNSTALSFGIINNAATINFDGINVVPINYPNLGLLNGANFPSTGTIGITGNFNPGAVTTATAGSTVSFIGTGVQAFPTSFTFDSVRINNPNVIFSGNLSISRGLVINENFKVDSSSTLTINAGATLSVAANKILTIFGTVDNQSVGAVTLSGNNIVIKSGAIYKVNATGITSAYNIPPAVYEAGSNLLVLQGSGKLPSDIGGDVTWSGTNTSSMLTAPTIIGGSFNITNGNLNNGSGRTLTIGGNLNVSGGVYTIGPPIGAGNGQTTTVNGSVNVSAGSLVVSAIDTSSALISNLNIKGNLLHTGGFVGFTSGYPAGKINFVGTYQTISTTGINNAGVISIGSATTAPSVTLNGNVIIPAASALKIIEGSLIVPPNTILTIEGTADFNNKSVVFKSDSTGTGSLGKVTGLVTGANNVTVERFISSLNNRAFRLLAPSLNTASTIKNNWQTGGAGIGTHITGPTTGSNGFDTATSSEPTIFTYNVDITPTTDIVPAWIPLPNTNIKKLEADTGYLVYIRGDRTINLFNADTTASSNTTLRATGTLITGTHTFNNLRPTVYNLITNPYPSAINWKSIHAANPDLLDRYIYLDPNIGTRGGYVVVNGDSSTTPAVAVNQGLDIQSGLAFFVRPLNTTSVTIDETHKSAVNKHDVFRTNNGSTERITSSLFFKTANGTRRLADGVSSLYNNNYSAGYGNEDALQIANFDEDVSIVSNGRMLAVEGRPLIDSSDTLQLNVANLSQKAYEWQFNTANFNTSILSAALKDKFLGSITPVNLNGITSIGFNITQDAASSAADRFQIVFSPAVSTADTVIVPLCSGGSILISSAVTGVQYQWQVYNGSAFVNIADNQNYQGTTTSNLQIANTSSVTKFRCIVNSSGGVSTSKVYSLTPKNYWTGSVSSVWENTAKWSCGKLPDATTDVIISSGPVILNSNASCRSLQVYPGAGFIVNPGYNIIIAH